MRNSSLYNHCLPGSRSSRSYSTCPFQRFKYTGCGTAHVQIHCHPETRLKVRSKKYAQVDVHVTGFTCIAYEYLYTNELIRQWSGKLIVLYTVISLHYLFCSWVCADVRVCVYMCAYVHVCIPLCILALIIQTRA